MPYLGDQGVPAPKISSTAPTITDPTPAKGTPPMQTPATPTSAEESAMIDAFSGGTPPPVGNPAAAEAAQELADAATRVANSDPRTTTSYSPGRGTSGLYR
jgi:predicted dehydrogenase